MTNFLLFLAAASVLAIIPGPGIFYVVGRTWAAGRADGMASSLGTMFGGLVHVLACVIGVSALIMASATAFTVLKVAGGVYLIYLGVQTWRSADREAMEIQQDSAKGIWRAFRQGIVVEATNPKTAAFFLAFIPQFIRPAEGPVALQFLLFGMVSVALNTMADVMAVLGAAELHARFIGRPSLFRALRKGSGALIASLGVGLLASQKSA